VTRHPLTLLLAGVVALAAFAGCGQQPTSPHTAALVADLPTGGNGDPGDTTVTPPPPPPPPVPKMVELQATFTDSASVAGAVVHLHISAQSFAQDTTGITYSITSPEGWADFPISGMMVVPGMGSAERTYAVQVPADAAPGVHYVDGQFNGGGNGLMRIYVLVQGGASP
jgi:hypothetical protein